jgi:copper resistance protein B
MRPAIACVGMLASGVSVAQHVPPDPPQQQLPHQSYEQMAAMMQMDDRERYGRITFDQLEWQDAREADVFAWDAQAFYGGDYHKLWLKTEGARADDEEQGRVEALWNRIVSPWWSLQLGVRQDFGDAPSRTWAALGIEGLAPQWFDVEAAIYIGEAGRAALRVDVSYDLLLTQRLVLQPQLEADAYSKDDRERGIGSGLSDVEVGLRLRYDWRRELAPYIGVQWVRLFGETADLAGGDQSDTQLIAGLRAWF